MTHGAYVRRRDKNGDAFLMLVNSDFIFIPEYNPEDNLMPIACAEIAAHIALNESADDATFDVIVDHEYNMES